MKTTSKTTATMFTIDNRTLNRWAAAGMPEEGRYDLIDQNGAWREYRAYDIAAILQWLRESGRLERAAATFNKANETKYTPDQFEVYITGLSEGLHLALDMHELPDDFAGEFDRLRELKREVFRRVCVENGVSYEPDQDEQDDTTPPDDDD